MRKFNEQNERIKRQYLGYLKEAKGQDETSLDKAAAAAPGLRGGARLQVFQGLPRRMGRALQAPSGEAATPPDGQAAGLVDAGFDAAAGQGLHPLARRRSRASSRASPTRTWPTSTTTRRTRGRRTSSGPIPYPSIEQCAHAFRSMPEDDEVARRDKAMFALLMLTRRPGWRCRLAPAQARVP